MTRAATVVALVARVRCRAALPAERVQQARRALSNITTAAALRELEDDWSAREHRRALRAPRRIGVRTQPQCPACRKFTRVKDSRESCGYHGGYHG